MPFSPLADLLGALARTFRELEVRWYVFGAQAAILHGAARLTADVDVTVQLASHSIADLLEALARAGFVSRVQDSVDFADRTRVLPLVHQGTRVPVDIVLAGPGLEAMFLERVEEHVIGDVRIPVASAGDVVLMKLLAGRAKDLEDVVAILRARRADIDVDTVRAALRTLEQALARADLVEALDRALADAARRASP